MTHPARELVPALLAAAILRDVPRTHIDPVWGEQPDPDGDFVSYADVLAALSRALGGDDLVERAGAVVERLRGRPDAIENVDRLRDEAAALIAALLARNAALTVERDEIREELLDLNKKSISKQASIQRALTAAEAEVEKLRGERDEARSEMKFHVNDAVKAWNAAEAAEAEVARLREAGKAVLRDIDELVANSEGVAGLHMNGDVAEWSSLMDGGEFGAWLSSVEGLRAALTTEDRHE